MIMEVQARGSRGVLRTLIMKESLFSIALVVFVAGCSTHTESIDPTASTETPAVAAQPAVTPTSPIMPLPFRVRLAQGDPSELPPDIAASLSNNAPITFTYREELSHDDYHIPLILTALDPITYLGAPLGDRTVEAFASLTIYDGEQVIGDYTAKARVSRSFTIYHEPTHAEVEREARNAVRQKIDDQLQKDAGKLAQAATNPQSAREASALDR
jgi:hypothetical protein